MLLCVNNFLLRVYAICYWIHDKDILCRGTHWTWVFPIRHVHFSLDGTLNENPDVCFLSSRSVAGSAGVTQRPLVTSQLMVTSSCLLTSLVTSVMVKSRTQCKVARRMLQTRRKTSLRYKMTLRREVTSHCLGVFFGMTSAVAHAFCSFLRHSWVYVSCAHTGEIQNGWKRGGVSLIRTKKTTFIWAKKWTQPLLFFSCWFSCWMFSVLVGKVSLVEG